MDFTLLACLRVMPADSGLEEGRLLAALAGRDGAVAFFPQRSRSRTCATILGPGMRTKRGLPGRTNAEHLPNAPKS